MKENSIRRAVRGGRAALGTGLKEFASRGVPWIIEASGFDYHMIRNGEKHCNSAYLISEQYYALFKA
jgi:hypothetical protein